jgi:ankyrin repeat protein
MGEDRSRNQACRKSLPYSPLYVAAIAALVLAMQPTEPLQAASAIARAARDGDFAKVQALITSGAAVNEAEADGSTALLWAAYQSDPDMVTALIAAGADPNSANRFGVTPLLQAARTGDTPVIRALLDGGAKLESALLSGETPLMAAARAGSVNAVSLLLENGSDPNATESYQGQTALMWAAAEGHTDVVRRLLAAGADPDTQARVSELTERSTRTDFPSGGFTAAMWAAREGYEDELRVLADAGADLELKNADGATAMMIAIVNDRFDLAARMLDMGAEPDNGSLYYAVLMRDATTDWLAKDGSRWRADYPNDLTALDLIGVLLEAGADPNRPFEGQMHSASMCCDTRESGTPFYRAAVAADVEALKLLIDHGADVEWMPTPSEDSARGPGGPGGGGAGRSPLAAAMNGGKGVGMAGGPGDIREDRPPPFREVADRKPVDAMRVLLEAGADPNRPTTNDSTLLHDAARARDLDIIRTLAEHGADLAALNGSGLTALDVAEGRRGEGGGGGGRRGFGGGGIPGLMGGNDDRPSNEEVAALLRELMTAQGVEIVEHGTAASDSADEAG